MITVGASRVVMLAGALWLGDHAAALREIGRCWGKWSDTAYTIPAGTLELLPALWAKGYRYFAAEAFDWRDSSLNRRAYAVSGISGGYVDEPVFGEIVREARRLGYTLVPYEMEPAQDVRTDSLNPQQRRDRAQARNLNDRIFRVDPNAKVLVHAGYSHIKERADSVWSPMAAYLHQLTDIDPVTVDQTMLAEMSEPAMEHPAYRAAQAAKLVGKTPRASTVTLFLPPGQRTRILVLSTAAEVLRTVDR